MATKIWLNIGLDNGLVPSGNKPLSKPLLTYNSMRPSYIQLLKGNFTETVLYISHCKVFKYYIFENTATCPSAQCIKGLKLGSPHHLFRSVSRVLHWYLDSPSRSRKHRIGFCRACWVYDRWDWSFCLIKWTHKLGQFLEHTKKILKEKLHKLPKFLPEPVLTPALVSTAHCYQPYLVIVVK